jgi:transcriptional regulator GlxA family with amidase domain
MLQDGSTMGDPKRRRLGVVLFPVFELLDVFGPLEMFGLLSAQIEITTIAERPGPVASFQGPEVVATCSFADAPPLDLLLVPGGFGTRVEAGNAALLAFLRAQAARAEITMSVCSGSLLLASAGLLDDRQATTNKMFFAEIAGAAPRVHWVRQARWVEDGRFFTSSGVSAGIDMALAVIARLFGEQTGEDVALATEYDWHRDAGWDPFAAKHGLV